MRTVIVAGLMLALAGCSKDRPEHAEPGTTTTTGARTVTTIRRVLADERPSRSEDIERLVITDRDGVVTLSGEVTDERTRQELIDTVRRVDGVKDVRDDLRVRVEGVTDTATKRAVEVRTTMATENPREAAIVNELVIDADEDGIVTIAGTVPDDATRRALVKSAAHAPGVTRVRDELRVAAP